MLLTDNTTEKENSEQRERHRETKREKTRPKQSDRLKECITTCSFTCCQNESFIVIYRKRGVVGVGGEGWRGGERKKKDGRVKAVTNLVQKKEGGKNAH